MNFLHAIPILFSLSAPFALSLRSVIGLSFVFHGSDDAGDDDGDDDNDDDDDNGDGDNDNSDGDDDDNYQQNQYQF